MLLKNWLRTILMIKNYNDMFKSIYSYGGALDSDLWKPLKGRVVEIQISDVNGFEWLDIEYDTHDHVNNKRIEVKSAKHSLYTKRGGTKAKTLCLRIKNARGDSWGNKSKEQQISDICSLFDELWIVDTGTKLSYSVAKISSSDLERYGNFKNSKDGIGVQVDSDKLDFVVTPPDINVEMPERDKRFIKKYNYETIDRIVRHALDHPKNGLEKILGGWFT